QGPITIRTADGQTLQAEPVLVDQANDIALLKIVGDGANQTFNTIPLGNENNVTGQEFAIGHPLGDPNLSVQPGNFAGVSRFGDFDVTDNTVADNRNRPLLDFTNMGTQPGSSGSPIINANGEVVGMDDLGDGQGNSEATVVSAIINDLQMVA